MALTAKDAQATNTGMEVHKSDLFPKYSPIVDPPALVIYLPCHGGYKDATKLKIKNRTAGRIMWKLKCTKMNKFVGVEPTMGLINTMDGEEVDFQPKPIKTKDEIQRTDHFTFTFAPAPPGQLWTADAAWRDLKPQHVYNLSVPIWLEDKPKTPMAKTPQKEEKPKEEPKEEGEAGGGLKPRVIVKPKIMNLVVPCKDHKKFEVTIRNKGKKKLAFKTKGTKVDRFHVEPITGHILGGKTVTLSIKAVDFTGADGLSMRDRVTILMTNSGKDGKEDWDKKFALRQVVKMVYDEKDVKSVEYGLKTEESSAESSEEESGESSEEE